MPSERSRRLAFAVMTSAIATLSSLVPSREASAFCRTTVALSSGEGEGCPAGKPLYHPSQCVPYRLVLPESSVLPNVVLSNSLARAFSTWTSFNGECVPGISGVELASIEASPIASYTVGSRQDNRVGVVSGAWPHGDDGQTLALTTLTFSADTGEVFDADLELRGDTEWSTAATTPPTATDLDTVVTHEVGHFLGLAHSTNASAVMAPTYLPGSPPRRALAADDAAGICTIYPTRQVRATAAGQLPSTACNLAASAGGPGGACGDPAITNGCAVSPRGSSAPPDIAFALGLAAAVAAVVRARTRPRRARRLVS